MTSIEGFNSTMIGFFPPICTFDLMKKLVTIILALVATSLNTQAQTSEAEAIPPPLVVRVEMENAGLKLTHEQYSKLLKSHQAYNTKIKDANKSGNPTAAKQIKQEYIKDLGMFLDAKQMEKYNQIQVEKLNKKIE